MGRYSGVLLYLLKCSLHKKGATKEFGTRMLAKVKDLRFFLVLQGFLDILLIHDKANRLVQPDACDIWHANAYIENCRRELDNLIFPFLKSILPFMEFLKLLRICLHNFDIKAKS